LVQGPQVKAEQLFRGRGRTGARTAVIRIVGALLRTVYVIARISARDRRNRCDLDKSTCPNRQSKCDVQA
jgi:hypothetical protein